MKIFYEDEGVIDETFIEMIILNLIRITSRRESSLEIDFGDDDDRRTSFRLITAKNFFNNEVFCGGVRFNAYLFRRKNERPASEIRAYRVSIISFEDHRTSFDPIDSKLYVRSQFTIMR